MSLSLSHLYPGSGVVLDCIDSVSLHPYLLQSKFLTVILSLFHLYPGSGVVLDCIDSSSLHPYLLSSKFLLKQRRLKNHKHFRLTNLILLNFSGCFHNHPQKLIYVHFSYFIARYHGNQQRRISPKMAKNVIPNYQR